MILHALLEKQAQSEPLFLSRGRRGDPRLASLGQKSVVLNLKPHQNPHEIGALPNRERHGVDQIISAHSRSTKGM